ncbi:MAG: amidohydrolase family protein [Theionarchaea archaeon]|nr:amidohydrolase family protein [Theionarchaea archaeon]MBU6999385.1 amidohydrolase family protein [Theionarchaea archaeon]MBU7021349.1 amidohydrolase family protein [Theionarchaea archaeon]MBU7041576.1 amidohydrolase family protein [Theionarchaea archaeon]
MKKEMILIKAGAIIDGTGAAPLKDSTILVEGDTITSVGGNHGNPDTVIDLSEYTVLPGLMDCHVHTSFNGEPNYYDIVLKQSTAYRTLTSLRNVQNDLMAGFTTVRVMGEKSHLDIALKNAIQEGVVAGPRIVASGQNITVTGGHADLWLAQDIQYKEGLGGVIVDGPEEFRKAARIQLKYGADLIKLVVTGGIMSAGGDPGMPYHSAEEIRAAVEEAHRLHKKAAAHCHGAEGARISVEQGVDTIEHGTYLIKEPDVIDLMAKKGAFLVPTLKATILHEDEIEGLPDFYVRKTREAQGYAIKSVQYAMKKGIRIAAGTDAGSPGNRHGENAEELEMLVKAGMTEMEAIVAATRTASECLGIQNDVGVLEKGKRADIIAVRGDPLSDISILKTVPFVMKEGKIFKEVS